MKRVILLFCAVLLLGPIYISAGAVSTGASCAILMDAGSGRILYEQNIHERRPIASITKLMTALVAVENTEDLETLITIQPEWTGIEGSSIYLNPNEKISMKALRYGLLLQSGNDAAAAIAGYVAGGEEAFAELMNDRAVRLNMKNSHFTNPSGLSDEGHYSTAYDMALLARECLNNQILAEMCATQRVEIEGRTFYNHNKLLHRYEGCIGMKTGYTELAGRTLVSAAVKDGQTLICVTLNDRNDWNDHEKLFDYGFGTYPAHVLCTQGDRFGSIRISGSLIPVLNVAAERTLAYPLKAGECPKLTVELAEEAAAPVKAGMPVGRAVWSLNGDVIGEIALICSGSADRNSYETAKLWDRFFTGTRRISAPSGAHLI